MNHHPSRVGKLIRTAATDAGLTLRALGDRLGVSRPTIYAYVSGALNVPENRIAKISELTGKDPSFFAEAYDPGDLGSGPARMELIDALLSPPDPKAASQIASEVVESGATVESPLELAKLLFRTGNALLQRGDYLDATQQLEEARKLFAAEGRVESAASCRQSLGYCWTNLGRLDRARACFEYSRDHAAPQNRWTGVISLAALTQREGDFAAAEKMMVALREDGALPDEAKAYVAANQADLLCARGKWAEALAAIEPALALAYRDRLTDQVAELLIQKGSALTHLGDFEGASLSLVRAGDVCFSMQDEARSTLQELAWARFLGCLGRLSEARRVAVLAMAAATRGQYRRSESIALSLLAEISLARKDDEQAYEYALQALTHAQTHHYPAEGVTAGVALALAEAGLGRLNRADSVLAEAEATSVRLGLGESAARIARAKAVVEWAKGRRDEAVAQWTVAANAAMDMGLAPLAAQILWEAGQSLGDTTDNSESEAPARKAQAIAGRLLGQRILFEPGSDLREEMVTAAEWLGQALV